MMHIAFDAKRAFQNSTGLGNYSRSLISSLAQFYPDNDYTLFAPKLTNRFNTSGFANIETVTPKGMRNELLKAAWRSKWVTADLQRLGVDLYHGLSHEIPVGISKTEIKTVLTVHDLIFERYPHQFKPFDRWMYRRKIKYAAAHAHKIIAISEQTKQDLIQFYQVPQRKIVVCYQSCNPAFEQKISETEKERIRQKYQLPPQFLLYVGSVIERKNLLTICLSLKELEGSAKIPLVVIGSGGAYKVKVEVWLKSEGMENQVIFLSDHPSAKNDPDFASAADFPAIYQNALCMIYPSIFEGFGIPVLEALWSGLPVITSNISCLPETGGDAAYYINPTSVEEMTTAITRLVTDHNLRTQLIEKGFAQAQNFHPRRCAEAVMQVYTSLVKD